jgi:hypothetical protein
MRFPNDVPFHLRMAALVIGSLFLEQLAQKHLPHWSSPQIGIVTFVLGLAWVALFAFQLGKVSHDRVRVLEDRIERLTHRVDAAEDSQRARRSLPPM